MKHKLFGTAIFVGLALIGASLVAQELIATPDAIGGQKPDASINNSPSVSTSSASAANTAAASAANHGRYQWYDGRWWYWTSENRWMWYSDHGRWMEFDAHHGHNPPPAHSSDYHPGPAVGVRPCGNVNVSVGRVSVDVSGPHGAVRVGRLCIGW